METMKKTTRLGMTLMLILLTASANTWAQASTGTTTKDATNLVVDFEKTSLDSRLNVGQSAVLNLVIENTGDYGAENVEVYLTGNAKISADKKIYIGTVKASESKTIPVWVKVPEDAGTGLTAIAVLITYDGYDSSGKRENDESTKWEIPVTVYGEPLFQVSSSKTTYYKDNLEALNLAITGNTAAKDLTVEISSDCLTVIGSSRQYLGNANKYAEKEASFQIKPTETGACTATVGLYYSDDSGTRSTEEVSLGLVIEEAGVDFKIMNISYDPTGPGERLSLRLSIKNVGSGAAEDVTLDLGLSDPFTTASTSEKYIGDVRAGETFEEEFDLAVSYDADTKVYSIPLDINYKVGGTSYTVEKDVGIDVGGEVKLEVIKVTSSSGSLKIDVANVGSRSAESVKGTLIIGDGAVISTSSSVSSSQTQMQGPGGNPLNMLTGGNRRQSTDTQNTAAETEQVQYNRTMNATSQTQQYVSYKSDIKPTKQTTFTYDVSLSGAAILVLEYTGANNERVTQRVPITVGSGASSSFSTSRVSSVRGSSDQTMNYMIYAAIALVLVFAGYKLYKKRKK